MAESWNLGSLYPEITPELYADIRDEAVKWRNATKKIFVCRDDLNRAVFENDTTRHIEENFNLFLNQCSDYLKDIGISENLPYRIEEERRDYRDLINKSIEYERDSSIFSALMMLKHCEEVMTGVSDYAEGPIRAFYVMEDIKNSEPDPIQNQKRDTMEITKNYYTGFEINRERRKQRMENSSARLMRPRDIVVGEGPRHLGPTGRLVFGLNEYIQPKEQLLGFNKTDIEEIKENVGQKLYDFVKTKNRLRKTFRLRKVPKTLLENPDFLEMMIDEIKPRTPLDVVSAHPLQQKIRYEIREDEGLSDRLAEIWELYWRVRPPGCSQAILYDFIGYVVFGTPEERLWVYSAYNTELGYPPLPGYENLSAEKVINPRSNFKMGSIVEKLPSYDLSGPPSSMIA